MEICHDIGCHWLSLEGCGKVNVGIRCQVSAMSRESVYLDCEAKLWFRNWERNYPLSPNFTRLEETCCLRDKNHVHISHSPSTE